MMPKRYDNARVNNECDNGITMLMILENYIVIIIVHCYIAQKLIQCKNYIYK